MTKYSDKIDQEKARNLGMVERALAEAEAPAGFIARKVDLSDLGTRQFPTTRFVLDPILPRREVTLLSAHGGSGKSILALAMAAHVAVGKAWGPFPAVLSPVVYVSLEDGADVMALRLQRICRAYGLGPEAVASNLTLIDASDSDDTSLAYEFSENGVRTLTCVTVGMEAVRLACAGAGLILIDNASDAYQGSDIEKRQVRKFIRALRKLAREQDAALLLLAHIDKAGAKLNTNGNSYLGSVAWHNSTRSRVALIEEGGSLKLVHEKHNLSAQAQDVPLRWTDEGVLMPASASEAKAAAAAAVAADDDVVLGALRAAIGRGVVVSASQTGPNTAWHALAPLPELPPELQDQKAGKRRTLRAIGRLEAGGKLTRETYKDRYRNDRQRLALTQTAAVDASESAAAVVPHTPCTTAAAAGRAAASVPKPALVQHQRSTNALTQPEGGKV